jgi:hypothetical protein
MVQLSYRNDFEGGGGNKVFDRGATSGRGHSREKFSFFELFSVIWCM